MEFSYYFSISLFSYRIQRAVNNAAKENTMSKQDVSNFGSIQKAVEMHKKTIKLVKLIQTS